MAKSFKKLVKKTGNAKTKRIAKERTKELLQNEDQYKHMIDRYGYSVKHAQVDIHLTYNEMVKYFGEQCKEYEPMCENCINWVKWNKTGTASIGFDRDEFMKQIFEGNL